ncbi:helix-turn-helix domain-containing protein [Planotetraspora phitsanulokensis]|uniref:Transcriptional regulator n=1 Tax=Planotetraspora phitsanulokensis TaxID=575192 RepID=A0A8J3U119_9ACTN|nr:helix-turn-helix domain-containing protein [Planotetraspora phitsanulokensis]GII35927.1 transcriptional regulator [Planotetraspora phitsanulokensis]
MAEIAEPAAEVESSCDEVRSILSRVGEKWAPQVMSELHSGPRRFNELLRLVAPITPRMLTVTLRGLESDGLITRTVHPTVPPQVEYGLTRAGRKLFGIVSAVVGWTDENLAAVHAARAAYKTTNG